MKIQMSSLFVFVTIITTFVVPEVYAMRWYSPATSRWLSRDPIGELPGLNVYAYVANAPIDLLDLFGLITGPSEIIALDKTYPASQAVTYTTCDVCSWETIGAISISGPNNQDSIDVYPTAESLAKKDSKVVAHTKQGDEEISITVRRPKYLLRPRVGAASRRVFGSTTPGLGIVPVATVYTLRFFWLIQDQFHDGLPGVGVGERISNTVRIGVASLQGWNQTGVGTTDGAGLVPDVYYLSFWGRENGSYGFDQTIFVGNWEAETSTILWQSGFHDWSGGTTYTFY